MECYLALILADIGALLIGVGAAGYAYLGQEGGLAAIQRGQVLLPVFFVIALYNGAYSMDSLRSTGRAIFRAEVALLISSAAVIFIAFFTNVSTDFSRASFLGGIAGASVVLAWSRLQMRSFIRWRVWCQRDE